MFWIEGVSRTNTGFALRTITPEGDRQLRTLADLSESSETAKTHRTRLTSDFSTWARHSAEPFWDKLGLRGHRPDDDHTVFEFCHDGKRYLIPAQPLMAALMRPIKYVQTFLFRPSGLEAFSVPILTGGQPDIGLHLPAHRVFGSGGRTAPGITAAYSWLHCFPSARRAWDSVYVAACDGRLHLDLPLAQVSMSVRTIDMAEYRLVSNLVITSVCATEDAFAFAEGHPKCIALHQCSVMDWERAHTPPSTNIPPRGDQWALSDDEWTLISTSILKPGARSSARHLIDSILIKLGTGVAWRELDHGELSHAACQVMYWRMCRDGRWAAIESALLGVRSSASSTSSS